MVDVVEVVEVVKVVKVVDVVDVVKVVKVIEVVEVVEVVKVIEVVKVVKVDEVGTVAVQTPHHVKTDLHCLKHPIPPQKKLRVVHHQEPVVNQHLIAVTANNVVNTVVLMKGISVEIICKILCTTFSTCTIVVEESIDRHVTLPCTTIHATEWCFIKK